MKANGHNKKIHSFLKSNQKSLVSDTREFTVLINQLNTVKLVVSHQGSKLTGFQIRIVSNHGKRPRLIKNYHVMHFWNFLKIFEFFWIFLNFFLKMCNWIFSMIILHGRFIYFLNDSLSVNLRQLENVTVKKK